MSAVAASGPYLVSAVAVGVALYLSRSNKRKLDADTETSKAKTKLTTEETARVANEAAQINEKRERDREAYWQEQLEAIRTQAREDRTELVGLKRYVNRVVPWVWRAAQKMLNENIDFEAPPQLMPEEDGP